MAWSPQQDSALLAIRRWLEAKEWASNPSRQIFRLFGYAGTGKTSLARQIAEDHNGPVAFAAFTGKAASVLREKGCADATTIHRLIYQPVDRSREGVRAAESDVQGAEARIQAAREAGDAEQERIASEVLERARRRLIDERKSADRPDFARRQESLIDLVDLVIVDECSMVDGKMGNDLLSFGRPVLVLGDPAQLPPIGGGGFFTENVQPDVMLTEVHRQAQDSPVLRMATDVREGRTLALGDYGMGSSVIPVSETRRDPSIVTRADQLICGKNATRARSNARMRELHGRNGSAMPLDGDKLICLQNNHNLGLLNGELHRQCGDAEVLGDSQTIDLSLLPWEVDPASEDAVPMQVTAHIAPFIGKDLAELGGSRRWNNLFDYGYAITCHKAQGSQWDRLVVIDESFVFRADSRRWLYTAIARAAESVVVVR